MLIKVTHAALKQIREELQDIAPDVKDPFIRLYMGMGWGGPRLQLALEESSHPNDQVTEIEGIKFIIASNQTPYFQDTKLDYIKGVFGMGEFKILRV